MVRDYGFLMIKYDTPQFIKELHNTIPQDELYLEEDNDDYGIEGETHVTVVPCLDKNLDYKLLQEYLEDLKEYKLLVSNISKFSNDKYDVLKCDVASDVLMNTNDMIRSKFPTYSEHKVYHPHMTIAYLKKGMADKYLKHVISPLVVLSPQYFMWSGCNENGEDINIEWT